MMNVPVDDQDLAEAMLLLGVTGAHGNVVKYAEPHAARRHRVVPRRTHGAEGVASFAGAHRVDRSQDAADSELGNVKRLLAHRRVPRAQLACKSPNILLDNGHVVTAVAGQQLVRLAHHRLQPRQLGSKPSSFKRLVDGIQPSRTFGMPGAGEVVFVFCVENKCGSAVIVRIHSVCFVHADCSISSVVTRSIESEWTRRGRYRRTDCMNAVTTSQLEQSID